MLDELQRCLGTAQASKRRKMDAMQSKNCNLNLTGLLLPGTPLANALYSDALCELLTLAGNLGVRVRGGDTAYSHHT